MNLTKMPYYSPWFSDKNWKEPLVFKKECVYMVYDEAHQVDHCVPWGVCVGGCGSLGPLDIGALNDSV